LAWMAWSFKRTKSTFWQDAYCLISTLRQHASLIVVSAQWKGAARQRSAVTHTRATKDHDDYVTAHAAANNMWGRTSEAISRQPTASPQSRALARTFLMICATAGRVRSSSVDIHTLRLTLHWGMYLTAAPLPQSMTLTSMTYAPRKLAAQRERQPMSAGLATTITWRAAPGDMYSWIENLRCTSAGMRAPQIQACMQHPSRNAHCRWL